MSEKIKSRLLKVQKMNDCLQKIKNVEEYASLHRSILRELDEIDAMIERLPEPPFAILDSKMAFRIRSLALIP